MSAQTIKSALAKLADPAKAIILQRFFKTGPGEYGEGDIFWGIQIPQIRQIVKTNASTSVEVAVRLLHDDVHEVRIAGGLLLVEQYKKAGIEGKKACYEAYMTNATQFNNWDLVDLTCHHIVGAWLMDKDKTPLYELAHSGHLWKQRISMISTYYFLKRDEYTDTFNLATILLNHDHDLIHKAVGWMLREVGKRNHEAETNYLLEGERYKIMPRTMLRYAIERFPEPERQFFLKK
jgi:3-methyladenine DNA glycosylase AlkD